MVSSSTQQSSSQLTTPSLSTLENSKLNSYSINYNTLDHQKCPAPNVTVTASLSLSGVLQGQGLPAAINAKSQQPYKRFSNVNINNPNDNSRLLQQLIVQQHKLQEGRKPFLFLSFLNCYLTLCCKNKLKIHRYTFFIQSRSR